MEADNKGVTTSSRPLLLRPVVLLTILVVQNALTAVVGRVTRSGGPTETLFSINHYFLVGEVTKLVLSLGLEAWHCHTGSPSSSSQSLRSSLQRHVWQQPKEALRLAPVALLFFASNTFRYMALGHLKVPLFQVIVQSRLLTTAIWSVLLLQRRYGWKQWSCLATTTLGLILVVLGETQQQPTQQQQEETTSKHENEWIGILSLLASSFLSSLASVCLEKLYKAKPKAEKYHHHHQQQQQQQTQQEPSLWIRNIQLACFSILIASMQILVTTTTRANDNHHHKPFFYGFHPLVWLHVLLFSVGGVLVAAVTKYTDSVLKVLATVLSMLLSTILSAVLVLGAPIRSSKSFGVGAATIVASIYLFSNPWPAFYTTRHLPSLRHALVLLVLFCLLHVLYLQTGLLKQSPADWMLQSSGGNSTFSWDRIDPYKHT